MTARVRKSSTYELERSEEEEQEVTKGCLRYERAALQGLEMWTIAAECTLTLNFSSISGVYTKGGFPTEIAHQFCRRVLDLGTYAAKLLSSKYSPTLNVASETKVVNTKAFGTRSGLQVGVTDPCFQQQFNFPIKLVGLHIARWVSGGLGKRLWPLVF